MCTISINQPIAIISGSTITSITVTGTTSNCACSNVTVTIKCIASTGTPPFLVVPVTAGTFTATFAGAALQGCYCEKEILVSVRCDDHPIHSQGFRLDCNPCSDIRVLGIPEKVCTNAPFQFQIAHGSTGTINVNIDFGDNTSVIVLNVGNTPITVPIPPHIYTSPGTYTLTVWITGCPPQQYTITVVDCPTNCCPNAVAIITSEIKEECNADGETKNVKVDAVITPTPQPGCPSNIQAEMWIDNNLVATGSGSSPFTLSHQANYKCLDHNVVIKYPGSNCPDSGGIFCVSVCETKTCKFLRNVIESALTVAIISSILFLTSYVLVSYYPGTPSNGLILFSVGWSLFSLAMLALIAFIISCIIWLLIPCGKTCRPCRWLLIAWEVLLSSLLGFLILSKSSFQILYAWLTNLVGPVWSIIILVLIFLIWAIITLLLYLNWVAKCCPTKCEKWTHLLYTLVRCGVCYWFVISIIGSVTSLAPPLFWIIPVGWANFLFGLLVAYVLVKRDAACRP